MEINRSFIIFNCIRINLMDKLFNIKQIVKDTKVKVKFYLKFKQDKKYFENSIKLI